MFHIKESQWSGLWPETKQEEEMMQNTIKSLRQSNNIKTEMINKLNEEIKTLKIQLVNSQPSEVAEVVSDEILEQMKLRDNKIEELKKEMETYLQIMRSFRMAFNSILDDEDKENEEKTLNEFEMVGEFHEACDCDVYAEEREPELPENKIRALRRRLIREEFNEYLEAEDTNDIVGIADALADLCYVIYGAAHCYNIPLDKVYAEVHRSNMQKVGKDGKVTKREDGKILKPEGWEPPDIEGVMFPEDIIEAESE